MCPSRVLVSVAYLGLLPSSMSSHHHQIPYFSFFSFFSSSNILVDLLFPLEKQESMELAITQRSEDVITPLVAHLSMCHLFVAQGWLTELKIHYNHDVPPVKKSSIRMSQHSISHWVPLKMWALMTDWVMGTFNEWYLAFSFPFLDCFFLIFIFLFFNLHNRSWKIILHKIVVLIPKLWNFWLSLVLLPPLIFL